MATTTGYGISPYGEDGYGDVSTNPIPGTNINPIAIIEHVVLGLSRILMQYQNSPNFIAYLTAILSIMDELEATVQSLFSMPDIDVMTGANLDTIGIIVGATRYVNDVVALNYFGFSENGTVEHAYMVPFGELTNPAVGGRFYELGEAYEGSNVLQDPEFRLLIRAKIVTNQSTATGEDMIAALAYIFNSTVSVVDNYNMTFTFSIGRALTSTEQAIITTLDVLPRPAGVGIILP